MSPERAAENYASSERTKPFAMFSKRQFELYAMQSLGPRPYYESRKGLFYFAVALTFICQMASAISGYSFFESLIAIKLTGLWLIAASVVVLLVLEAAKYFVLNTVAQDYFHLSGVRNDAGTLVVALALSAISVYASISGGADLADDPALIASAEAKYKAKADVIRGEIKEIIRRNTWKNSTWIKKSDQKLIQQKEMQLADVLAAEKAELSNINARNNHNKDLYRYGFAAFEIIFILCTMFAWYFRKRVAVEAASVAIESNRTTNQPPAQPLPYSQQSNGERSIGFTFGWQQSETKVIKEVQKEAIQGYEITCLHCGKKSFKIRNTAKFCDDKCRNEYHKIRLQNARSKK